MQEVVTMWEITLPEFDKNRRINQQKVLVFDNNNVKYDIILGTEYKLSFQDWNKAELLRRKHGMVWLFHTTLSTWRFGFKKIDAMEDMFHIQVKDEIFGEDWLECFATEILDAKYEKTDVAEVIKRLTHLNAHQKADLLQVLQKNNEMFNGTLGVYPHKKVHIDIDPNAKPVHSRPYPVPWIHLKTFKKELNHLVRIGILAAQQESEWVSPSLIILKKNGRIHWISNLRHLNKVIRRKQYPLPIITDILHKRSWYKFFTKLDLSVQYYTFELDKESQDLCTIITPFGKYKYSRLPIGLKCSPDIVQAAMKNVLSDIKDANVYINYVGAFSNNWDHHVNLLATILWQLRENGFTINPLKCEWAVKETNWLGYWLTPQGLKPWKKKIDTILHMYCPCNTTELRMFIGCINYYHDMWPSCAHILKPLTDWSGLKKKDPIEWTDEMKKVFDKMHLLMAADALAAYPDHNKQFDVYTDDSDFQLGACIIQEGRPVAYFSWKPTKSQQNYPTTEKEMLFIVATLKEFWGMLLGADIHVFTDHKNLTFDTIKTQCVSCWRTKIEEFSPILHYIKNHATL
jgi:hypothetical protein